MTVRTGTTVPSSDVAKFAPSTRTRGGTLTNTTDVATFYPSSRMRGGSWTRLFNTACLPDLEYPMTIIPVLVNTATTISIFMRDANTGLGRAGLTLTIGFKKSNQITFSTITPTVTDTGGGWYDFAMTPTHLNTIGKAAMSITAANAAARNDVVLDVITADIFGTGISSAAQIRDAILDAARSGHVTAGTIGEGIALATSLLQGNFYMDQVVNGPNGQTSARIRCFFTGTAAAAATSGGSGQGEFATFVVTTTYSGPNMAATHRTVQQ